MGGLPSHRSWDETVCQTPAGSGLSGRLGRQEEPYPGPNGGGTRTPVWAEMGYLRFHFSLKQKRATYFKAEAVSQVCLCSLPQ